MSKTKSSAMKTDNSRTEDYISDPVLRMEKDAEPIRALAEKVDRARIDASEILMGAMGTYYCSSQGMDTPDAYFYCKNLYASEGIAGLEKRLAEISDYLHLDYLRFKLGIF